MFFDGIPEGLLGDFYDEFSFDYEWYKKGFLKDVSASDAFALSHFHKSGKNRGLLSSPFFNAAFVRVQMERLGLDVANNELKGYLLHSDVISPHPLLPCGKLALFDEYVGPGGRLSRSLELLKLVQDDDFKIGPFFDSAYIKEHMFEGELGVFSPLEVYLRRLFSANIRTSVFFDPDFYSASYPKVQRAIQKNELIVHSLLEHFLVFGLSEGKAPIPDFDPSFYVERYPDIGSVVESSSMTATEHFFEYGIYEGRMPNAFFNPSVYVEKQPNVSEEVIARGMSGPCEHFLKVGYGRGYKASEPLYNIRYDELMAKGLYEKAAYNTLTRVTRSGGGLVFPERRKGSDLISVIIPVCNQVHMTVHLLDQLNSEAWRTDTPDLEVILVDNGSNDLTAEIESYVKNLKVVRTPEAVGYTKACNLGAEVAKGQVLLFTNNDIEIVGSSISVAHQALLSDKTVGAVGGKILKFNGVLQEAGSVVHANGGTQGLGRFQDPNLPEYNVVRAVDYCSGCFLFVRTTDFFDLDGFDEEFSPGYYEEVDLCVRLLGRGLKTLYHPQVEIYHYEYASYSKGRPRSISLSLMKKNRQKFRRKHSAFLAEKQNKVPTNRFRALGEGSLSILFFEDFIPDRREGSGFVRAADTIDALLSMGHRLTLVAACYSPGESADRYRQKGVNVIEYFKEGLGVNDRSEFFDVAWVCRTHNIQRFSDELTQLKRRNPDLKVVFDTEAIASIRDRHRDEVFGVGVSTDIEDDVRFELESELQPSMVVAVNELDKEVVESVGYEVVEELGHSLAIRQDIPGISRRSDIFFCGSFHAEDSPNFDSIRWFIREVWPIIQEKDPTVRFNIAGHVGEGVNLVGLLDGQKNVEFLGRVESLDEFFDRSRVFVAPTRYAGGIPHKVHEAMAAGIPTVCTSLLAQQLSSKKFPLGKIPVLHAPPSDPEKFAGHCLKLLGDSKLWKSTSVKSQAFISNCASEESFQASITEILDKLA